MQYHYDNKKLYSRFMINTDEQYMDVNDLWSWRGAAVV